jgi:hypothetical protein
MAQGTVKRPGPDPGYGFTAPGGGAREVPVHHCAAGGCRIPRSASASRRRFPAAGDGAGHA